MFVARSSPRLYSTCKLPQKIFTMALLSNKTYSQNAHASLQKIINIYKYQLNIVTNNNKHIKILINIVQYTDDRYTFFVVTNIPILLSPILYSSTHPLCIPLLFKLRKGFLHGDKESPSYHGKERYSNLGNKVKKIKVYKKFNENEREEKKCKIMKT